MKEETIFQSTSLQYTEGTNAIIAYTVTSILRELHNSFPLSIEKWILPTFEKEKNFIDWKVMK